MTTATLDLDPAPPLDLSAVPRIPLSRLVRVELRKLTDTRSSRWLLATIALLTPVIIGIVYFVAEPAERTYFNFMGASSTPQGLLLPVLGILLVTSEWSQRTALVSFTLTPARSRVLAAKVVAVLLAGAAAIVLTLAVATLATVIGGAEGAWVGIGSDNVAKFALLVVTGVVQGLAFGLLFLNSSAAIVTYFVMPAVFSLVASLWAGLEKVQPWIDLWTSQQPLFNGSDLSGQEWAQLGTSTVLWVVLPFAVGLVRVLRAEVK